MNKPMRSRDWVWIPEQEKRGNQRDGSPTLQWWKDEVYRPQQAMHEKERSRPVAWGLPVTPYDRREGERYGVPGGDRAKQQNLPGGDRAICIITYQAVIGHGSMIYQEVNKQGNNMEYTAVIGPCSMVDKVMAGVATVLEGRNRMSS